VNKPSSVRDEEGLEVTAEVEAKVALCPICKELDKIEAMIRPVRASILDLTRKKNLPGKIEQLKVAKQWLVSEEQIAHQDEAIKKCKAKLKSIGRFTETDQNKLEQLAKTLEPMNKQYTVLLSTHPRCGACQIYLGPGHILVYEKVGRQYYCVSCPHEDFDYSKEDSVT
jgi:hypothetical protein